MIKFNTDLDTYEKRKGRNIEIRMKTKILSIFLIFTLNSTAQERTIIRDEQAVCQAFWQSFESDSLGFEFENYEKKSIGFYSIIHYTDTMVNMKACGGNDFNAEPYIIREHRFSCADISKMIFYNENKRIEKIGFYIEVYDNHGNYTNEELLFWAIYK